MKKINKDACLNVEIIEKSISPAPDLYIKKFKLKSTNTYLLFIESIIDSCFINDFILEYISYEFKIKKTDDLFNFLHSNIPTHKTEVVDNLDDLILFLLNGFAVIIVDGYETCIAIESKAKLSSDITEALNERTMQGPKDSFIENYQTNIGLIRKRLKTKKLKILEESVGSFSRSKVALLYIDDIPDDEVVKTIFERIKNINVESVYDVMQIVELISANEKNVFPNYQATERPDFVAQHLTNGRIAIVLENTPYVAIIPAVATDFFHSPEDLYNRPLNASVNRFIRLIAFFITLTMPAFYIAITTYNHETIPPSLIINFAIQRDGVPFSAVFEAVLMILTFEILRETDVRAPSSIGSSLSIVGALVLGEAAVTAGIVSPIMVIVIASTAISGLILSYIDTSYAVRLWRVFFLIGASIAGFVGMVAVGFVFLANVSSIKSFGTPFLEGIAPHGSDKKINNIFITFRNKYIKKGKSEDNKDKKEESDILWKS